MKYQNKKTGAVIEINSALNDPDWAPVGARPVKKNADKSESTTTVKKARKK